MCPQQITIISIFKPKECPDLENTVPSNPSHAVETFTHLTDVLKDQKGFIRQYWVLSLSPKLLLSGAENLG